MPSCAPGEKSNNHDMMKRIALLLAGMGIALWLPSCSLVRQSAPEHELTVLPTDEPLAFSMRSETTGRKVPMRPIPTRQAELVQKLNQLNEMETRAHRWSLSSQSPLPAYRYYLVCETIPEKGKEPASMRFYVRRLTRIGGATEYEFDAARYFTRASWRQARARLYGKAEKAVDAQGGSQPLKPLP